MDSPALPIPSGFAQWRWNAPILLAWLAMLVTVAWLVRPRKPTVQRFVLAGRRVASELGIMSIVAGEMGLAGVLLAAREGFRFGFVVFYVGLAAAVGMLVMGMGGFVHKPLRRLRVLSLGDFYEMRFGRRVRVLGGLLVLLAGCLKVGLLFRLGGFFLTVTTGIDDPATVRWLLAAVGAAVIAYTAWGGLVSVLAANYLQFIGVTVAMVLAALVCVQTIEIDRILYWVEHAHADAGVNPFAPRGIGTGRVVVTFVLVAASVSIWPTVLMRTCAARGTAAVRGMVTFSSIGLLVRTVVPALLGISAMVFFFAQPDLGAVFLSGGAPCDGVAALAAMPAFLSRYLPPELLGLVAVGGASAWTASLDSQLLCYGVVAGRDVVEPLCGRPLADRSQLRLYRTCVVALGGAWLAGGLWLPGPIPLWEHLAAGAGVYVAGALPVLWLGLHWRRASAFGAGAALVVSLAALAALGPIRDAVGLSCQAEIVVAAVTAAAFAVMVAGSLLVPDRTPRVLDMPAEDEGDDPTSRAGREGQA